MSLTHSVRLRQKLLTTGGGSVGIELEWLPVGTGLSLDLPFPGGHALRPVGMLFLDLAFNGLDAVEHFAPLILLFRREDRGAALGAVVEKGEDAEVVRVLDGIELVSVTLSALQGQAEHGFAQGVH